MKCPECKKKNLKSKVYVGTCTVSCVHSPDYYDEEGVFHRQSPIILSQSYSCSNGHIWDIYPESKEEN